MLAPAEDEYWTQEIEAPGQVGARMKMNRLALDHLGFIFDSHKGFVGVSLHSIERGGERERKLSQYEVQDDKRPAGFWVSGVGWMGWNHNLCGFNPLAAIFASSIFSMMIRIEEAQEEATKPTEAYNCKQRQSQW